MEEKPTIIQLYQLDLCSGSASATLICITGKDFLVLCLFRELLSVKLLAKIQVSKF